jgi:energy-coupling factor transporter ATP-binding protein EcfA2
MLGPVLLEGPDGGGKTTLARHLAAKFGLLSVKNGAPNPGDVLVDVYREQLQADTVIDRSWPSEVIYAPILKRPALITNHQSAALFGELRAKGGRIIICLPPLFTCEAAWKGRAGELFQDPAILEAAWKEYFELAFSFRSYPEFLMVHSRLRETAEEEVFEWLQQ